MKKSKHLYSILLYVAVLSLTFAAAVGGGKVATVFRENAPVLDRKTVIIDAGHGGIDGGTTSCTGVLESKINLQIALKLKDLMHLIGINTIMIRGEDRSIHTKGDTIAAQKISDLKERVRIVNESRNAIMVSIHQNYFTSSAYSGAQVFYSENQNSKEIAERLQQKFIYAVNPDSHRNIKKAKGIYLMEHVNCPSVLIECGFLSNPSEEALLRSNRYQLAICEIIASVCSEYLFANPNTHA